MPIPNALRSLIHDPAFWSDFFGEEIYFNDYSSLADPALEPPSYTIPIVFSITPRHHLRLLLGDHLNEFSLELVGTQDNFTTTVAYDCLDGHSFAWGLRWEEVDLFGRCLALQDPDWFHPGLLVLLLSRAAPATTEEEAALAFPLLESAWHSLDLFSPARINLLLSYCDARLSNAFWRFKEPLGWELQGVFHTSRRIENNELEFSHSAWNQFVKDAEELTRGTVNPERFLRTSPDVEKLALALAETADWDKAAALADALERAGCRQVTVLAALRSGVSAQVLWVLELLLGEPPGQLIRRHLGSPTRPLQASHRLEVQFPEVDPQLIREFLQTLFEQGWGTAGSPGGICAPLPENLAEEAYPVTLIGDTKEGLEAIRRLFARYGPPPGTAIFSYKERRHLSLTPGAEAGPALPAAIDDPETTGIPVGAPPFARDLEIQEVLAKLVLRPRWRHNDQGYLTWSEYYEDDNQNVGVREMAWQPETEQEREQAQRFYQAGNWKSYESLSELFNQPRLPGEYVVRGGIACNYMYFARTKDGLTLEVEEAQVLTHDEAIREVIRLTKESGICLWSNPGNFYWEPMPREAAIVFHEKFAGGRNHFRLPVGQPAENLAARNYHQAAEQGDAEAQASLAWCYANGKGVPHDDVEAARWYRLAAEQGLARAQVGFGYHLELGLGVAQDYAEAFRWYSRGAEQGHPYGQNNLGELYQRGLGVERNDAEAVRLFRLAADAGLNSAQYNLGTMYEQGRGMPQDLGEALRLYRLAADQGHAEAIEAFKRLSSAESGK